MMTEFNQLYAKDVMGRELRETITMVVAEALAQGLSPVTVADSLLETCIGSVYPGVNSDLRWVENAMRSIERVRSGDIATGNDALREAGSWNIHTRPNSK